MKKVLFIFAAIVMMVGFTTKVQAQSTTATASGNTASATLLSTMTLTNPTALAFGSFSSTVGGVITVDHTSTAIATSGDAGITIVPGGSNAAVFTVHSTAAGSYSVSTIAAVNLTRTGGSEIMPVTFTHSAPGTFDASGNNTLYVGGSLTVSATQVPGSYVGTYDVTVNHD